MVEEQQVSAGYIKRDTKFSMFCTWENMMLCSSKANNHKGADILYKYISLTFLNEHMEIIPCILPEVYKNSIGKIWSCILQQEV